MVWAGGVAGVTKAGGTNEGVRMLYIVEIRYNERGESSIRSSELVIDVNGGGWATAVCRRRYRMINEHGRCSGQSRLVAWLYRRCIELERRVVGAWDGCRCRCVVRAEEMRARRYLQRFNTISWHLDIYNSSTQLAYNYPRRSSRTGYRVIWRCRHMKKAIGEMIGFPLNLK